MHIRHEARRFRVVVGRWGIVTGLVLVVLLPALPAFSTQRVQAATRVVMNLQDTGTDSLRRVLSDAMLNDTITFAPGLTGTISLTSTLILRRDVTISGPGAASLAFSGGCTTCGVGGSHSDGVRVFTVNGGVTASISGVTITRGLGDADSGGGGILNWGTLTLTNSTVSGNATANGDNSASFFGGNGGGIANTGTLICMGCTIGGANASDGNITGRGGNNGGLGGIGGGIYNAGTLSLTNSTISHNTTGGGGADSNDGGGGGAGGGIHSQGTLTLTNSTISGNITGNGAFSSIGTSGDGGNGGGIHTSGTLTLTGSTISSNTTGNGAFSSIGTSGDGGNGGGIHTSGTLTLTGNTISGNTTGNGGDGGSTALNGSGGDGGGIASIGMTLTGSTISGNTTGSSGVGGNGGRGGQGGGLYTFGGGTPSVVAGSAFTGNTAAAGGGIWNRSGTTLTVTGSTFVTNAAITASGGGFYNEGTATVANATFSANNASYGGGIINGGVLTARNLTLSGNVAGFNGGGVYQYGATLDIGNILLSTNTAAISGADFYYLGGTVTNRGHNFVTTSVGTTFNESGDIAGNAMPMLGLLADNGGAVTLPDGTHPKTLSLLSGSPAIDMGDNALCAAAAVGNLDARGVTRPKGMACDIGAFEVLSVAAILSPTNYAVGTAGGRVILVGTNLESVTSVTLDGVSVSGAVSSAGGTQLSVPIPARAVGMTLAVVVTNMEAGTSKVTATLMYTNPNTAPAPHAPGAAAANTPVPQPTPRATTPPLPAGTPMPQSQPTRH